MALTPAQYMNETIYRQIKVSRYATGQAKYARELLDKLNNKIADYILQIDVIEIKSQYVDAKGYAKRTCAEYRDKFYSYMKKELHDFIEEQSIWVYTNSPVELKKKKIDAILRNVFFEAFSDTENIKAFIIRIFQQVYSLWNGQLTIAYRVKGKTKDMVNLILGREIK
jgi:hypothetical protein